MDQNERMSQLFDEALSGKLSRRMVLRRGLALGLSVPALGALLAACGNGGGGAATNTPGAGGAAGGTATTGGRTPTMGAASPTRGAASPTMGASPTRGGASPTGGAASPTKGAASPTKGTASPATGGAITRSNPPTVANAAAAKQYSGTKLVFWGDAVGPGAELDTILTGQFTKDTGIQVQVVPRPQSATESYSQYQRTFQGQSGDFDAGMIDVIWPGAFAQNLVDLSSAFSTDIGRYYETIVTNNTVNNKLVAIPWFGDFGMLFYRTDLIKKYGFSGPPATWDDLEQQAQAIMDGEKAANQNFTGFVFQGNAYEGLTVDALEWIASAGGGTIVENGTVTINNNAAKAMLNRARGWVGGISPTGVTGYQEEDARNAFQGGNAAFMRNWPYAYSAGKAADSVIKDTFDVAPIPAQPGNDNVGGVGGWQLAVNNYSKNKEAAIELVRYLSSAEVQAFRAVIGSFVPTMPEVSADPRVAKAMPFLQGLANVVRVTRPSREAGANYNELSTIVFQGVNQILTGSDANDVVPTIESDITALLG